MHVRDPVDGEDGDLPGVGVAAPVGVLLGDASEQALDLVADRIGFVPGANVSRTLTCRLTGFIRGIDV
jgi:hypothetical protein